MPVTNKPSPAPSPRASWLNPWNVALLGLVCFMAGLWIGANFVSGKQAVPPSMMGADGLPPGHPPIDGAGMAGSMPVSNPHQHMEADPSFDDPAIRAEIENANDFDKLVQIGNREFDAAPRRSALAAAAYEKALSIKPKDPNVLTDLGTVYRDMVRYDDAIRMFKEAASIDRSHAISRYNLGIVLRYDKNDLPGAIAAWEDYLKVAPRGPMAAQVREDLKEMRR
jgi:tetratricopeptide (TPR) repeat protein